MTDTNNNNTQVDNPESTDEVQETPINSLDDAFNAVRAARGQKPVDTEEAESPDEAEAESDETEETEEEVDTSTETETQSEEETEETEDETESDEKDDDVLSQVKDIDFDSLSEEVQDAIAEKLEVKSHKAFAEMRKRLKEAEGKLESTQAEQAIKAAEVVQGPNQFAKESDPQAITKQVEQAQVNVEYFTDALLRNQVTEVNDDGDEVKGIYHEGKFYDKDSVLKYVDAQKGVLRDGPTRVKQLESVKQFQSKQDDLVAETKAKLKIAPDSKASDAYDELVNDQSFQTVARVLPDYATKLIDLFGKAAVAEVSSKDGKILIPRKGPTGKKNDVNVTTKGASVAKKGSAESQLAALTKRLKKGVTSPNEAVEIARQQRQLRKQLK